MSKASRRRNKRLRKHLSKIEEKASIRRRRVQKRERAKAKKELPRIVVDQDREYVILQTYAQQEAKVAERLKKLHDVPAYDPSETRETVRSGKPRTLTRRPMPRNLFSGLRKGEDAHSYTEAPGRGVQGVYGPFTSNGRVAKFRPGEVQRFMDRVRDQQIASIGSRYEPGSYAWVAKGTFGPGRYKVEDVLKNGGLRVWAHILGKDQLVDIEAEDLEEAA